MILTVDLGTSVTKVALWEADGLVALARSPLTTHRLAPDRAEQDPAQWWASVMAACAEVRAMAGQGFGQVDVVGLTGARQTLVLVGEDGQPRGPAIVWTDRRAATEAAVLCRRLGAGESIPQPGGVPAPGGIVVDAGSVAAKLAWLAVHCGDRMEASRWVLAPRDLVVAQMTGEVVTDVTMASRSGLYDPEGKLDEVLAGPAAALLPPVVSSDRVVGGVAAGPAAELGLAAGTPVVIGAADRPAEVLGTGADSTRPMVSWGTTANVSVPVDSLPDPPPGIVVSRGGAGGWLLEGGLSAAGSLLAWISRLTGQSPEVLAERARQCPPGAGGVTATPWLDGARAPWWRPDATVALVGLASVHGPAELARAGFEAVAVEVCRCLEAISERLDGIDPTRLWLAGQGATVAVWSEVITGTAGLPAERRRSGQAASAGAALLAGRAVGIDLDLDRLDPVVDVRAPDPAVVARYAALRERADRVAHAALDLGPLSDDLDSSGQPTCD